MRIKLRPRPTGYQLSERHCTSIDHVQRTLDKGLRAIARGEIANNDTNRLIQELFTMVAQVTQEILDKVNAQTSRLDGMVAVVNELKAAAANPNDSVALANLRLILGELVESDAAIQKLDDALKANAPS